MKLDHGDPVPTIGDTLATDRTARSGTIHGWAVALQDENWLTVTVVENPASTTFWNSAAVMGMP